MGFFKNWIGPKVRYVKKAKQTRFHHCHWPGCDQQVPPALWGCRKHWFMLPKTIRDQIWLTYRIGQEINGNPSDRYLAAAQQAQEWIKENCSRSRGKS